MSTTKPRITLTLEPAVYEVLRRLSAASGDSMSAVVADFLDVAIPQMDRMVTILEQAKAIPQQTKDELRESLERGEARVLSALDDATAHSLLLMARMENATQAAGAGGASPRTKRATAGGSTPVPLTGGSGRVGKPVKTVKTASEKGVRRGRV